MAESAEAVPGRGSEEWRGDELNRRRWRLFLLAAPVFRRHGYRRATIKELAHACHMSPAALYYYFPSKAGLATFPLDQSMPDWEEAMPAPGTDPLIQLQEMLDIAIVELPDYMLAMDLAREMGRLMGPGELAASFQAGDSLFGTRIAAVAPKLGRPEATELARRLMAILIAPYAMGFDTEPATTRARAVDVLRMHLVPAGVDGERFDAAMHRG